MGTICLMLAGIIGLITSLSLIPLIVVITHRYGLARRVIESHHTHKIPVPRFGGVALAAVLLVSVMVFSFLMPGFCLQRDLWFVSCSSLAMFGLGFWDDLVGLGAKRKLAGQVFIASLTYFLGIGISHFRLPFTTHLITFGLWAWPVTVIWLVAMSNLINLIDGIDGLAGGICLMLMGLLVYVSGVDSFSAIIAASLLGGLLGFLRFNFPPARIYLGDGGAYFLGYLIGCLTIVGSQKGTIFAALVAPLFVLALPIIDTSLAILRRGLRGLPIFRPDRKHLHHRLLSLGYSRRKVVLGLYAFTAFFLLLGFMAFYMHGQYLALFLGIGTLVVILVAGRFSFSREWFSIGRVVENSLEARGDIHYAMGLSHCLAMEGARDTSLISIVEDMVHMAGKVGFSTVRVRLEDDEKVWELNDKSLVTFGTFKYPLTGHKYCFLELTLGGEWNSAKPSKSRFNTYSIQAELLAEGLNKALNQWQRRNHLTMRFDAKLTPKSTKLGPLVATPSGSVRAVAEL